VERDPHPPAVRLRVKTPFTTNPVYLGDEGDFTRKGVRFGREIEVQCGNEFTAGFTG